MISEYLLFKNKPIETSFAAKDEKHQHPDEQTIIYLPQQGIYGHEWTIIEKHFFPQMNADKHR